MYIYTFEDALFCYKQSSDNTSSVTFSQRTNSPCLSEDETSNECGIINNLIDYVDGQEEPDSFEADKIYARIQHCNKLGKHFLKINTNSERSILDVEDAPRTGRPVVKNVDKTTEKSQLIAILSEPIQKTNVQGLVLHVPANPVGRRCQLKRQGSVPSDPPL
ncbi:uncharacterized protein TNCV_1052491 [Trichonephila clavipes]|nr:uncharacterized protein TNCV_1052491 [Trichonephila clavipes]